MRAALRDRIIEFNSLSLARVVLFGCIVGVRFAIAVCLLIWPVAGDARPMRPFDPRAALATPGAPWATAIAPPAPTRLKKGRKRRKWRRRRFRARSRLVQLRSGAVFKVRDPRRAWGTPLAVRRLTEVLTAYHKRLPDAPPLIVHDLSRRRGGRLPPHSSHRGGRDVDIRLPLDPPTKRYINATPRTLHLERTWTLIELLYNTGDVQEILLDRRLQRVLRRYARARGVSAATLSVMMEFPGHRHRKPRPKVIHWKGHRDHMHVRFRPADQAPRQLVVPMRVGTVP